MSLYGDPEIDVGVLIAEQSADFESLHRHIQAVETLITSKRSAPVLASRNDYIKYLWANCQGRNGQIHRLATKDEKKQLKYFTASEFGNMETTVFNCLDNITETLVALTPVQQSPPLPQQQERQPINNGNVKLPRIDLVSFSGQFTTWQAFKDSFVSLVKSNQHLDDVSKLHYLRSSLKDEAFDQIGHLEIVNGNFEIAWDILVKHYDNPTSLINAHLNAIFSIEPLQKESPHKLKALRNSMQKHIGALKRLNRETDGYNDILINRVETLLDPCTKRDWKLLIASQTEFPTYEDLDKFLVERVRGLDSPKGSLQQNTQAMSQKLQRHVNVKSHHISTPVNSCVICSQAHAIFKCPKFKDSSSLERLTLVKQHNLCTNCLKANHKANDCKSRFVCFKCHNKHHTSLHRDTLKNDSSSVNQNSIQPSTSKSNDLQVTTQTHFAVANASSRIFLATARVWVLAPNGRAVRVRALLDQGSTCSFVSRHLVQALGVKLVNVNMTMSGLGESKVGTSSHSAEIHISAHISGESAVVTNALVIPKITTYVPNYKLPISQWSHLADLHLADDPSNHDPIHLLIGADFYGMFLLEGLRKGKPGEPIAQKTVFGWVLSGNVIQPHSRSSHTVTAHLCISNQALDNSLKRFWEIEDIPNMPVLSIDDELCEQHFRQTHTRENGRYIVRLPFKSPLPLDIGESRHIAESMLKRNENRLARNEHHRSLYSDFMAEYRSLHHMALRQTMPQIEHTSKPVFLPHHPVLRESSQTTKLRVVFNASSKTSNNTSLNDHMHTGPALQADLSTILMNWRSYKFVLTADIAKMYRQIGVNHLDVPYQCILWRDSTQEPIEEYYLLTVTYGTRSAPFLALRVLQQLVEDEGSSFPVASDILKYDTFVDDLLFGAHTKHAAIDARVEVTALLDRGKFQARKWSSNNLNLLEGIDPSNHGLSSALLLGENEGVKILGIKWNPLSDIFEFDVSVKPLEIVTKRITVSLLAKIFDPLGWVSPVIVVGKMFIQRLWRENHPWDDPLPQSLASSICAFFSSLTELSQLSIPRWTNFSPEIVDAQLHGFADASEKAYGAVVYLRVKLPSGHINISLMSSKTRVAPIKFESIPRLELLAAVVLARLIKSILEARTLSALRYQCWSDSSLVLTWVKGHSSQWKTYIANRVSQIHTLLPDHHWRYVPTESNPADLLSRGMSVHTLKGSALWWKGPSWLSLDESQWPTNIIHLSPDDNLEEKAQVHTTLISPSSCLLNLAERCSSWYKMLRITATVFKAIAILKPVLIKAKPVEGINPVITAKDLIYAETMIIKVLQGLMFPNELKTLNDNQPLPRLSKLQSLNPFLEDQIIRVGGRLSQSNLDRASKYPIVLARHYVTTLIIRDAHLRCLHGGVQLTLTTLRQSYWVLNPRPQVKSVIHRCVPCAKARARLSTQIMADLPSTRVSQPNRAFTDCGVDYAGPLRLRMVGGRGHRVHSGYIVVFVCFAVKAVHLEVVSDYSSTAFIAAFKRFVSRRGIPARMHSDCGTTFKGADNELQRAFINACTSTDFKDFLTQDRISWHFNPPAAPHFGGLWEAGVKSVKSHLKRILADKNPTLEELSTLLCQIEAALNSRPLGPLHDHIDNCDPLTPGHFLIGSNLIAIPQPSLIDINTNRLSRWSMIQQCFEIFWREWSNDYLQSLQQRTKWRLAHVNLKVGQIVLLKQPNLPPTKWLLGRVEKCCPDRKGNVRVVHIKTANSSFIRPITEVCLLPTDLENMDAPSQQIK